MTSERRFEQELPGLLDDLYMGPMPAYRDHVLHHTARIRQRPAWSFPERWLPMVDIARQPILAPRFPWRSISLALLAIALLLAAAAVFIGSQPRLPAPFGVARNGLIAYDARGDIYVGDPVTGESTAIVTGPETDVNPRWSRDGTALAFERKAEGDVSAGLLFVVRHDGSDLIQLTPEPLPFIETYAFSPDGTQLLITASPAAVPRILMAATDGSAIRQLDVPRPARSASWRPDGSEILFLDSPEATGIFAVSPAGGTVRTIVESTANRYRSDPQWSPDGSLISYIEWGDAEAMTAETHIIGAAGTGDRILPMPPDADWQAAWFWSNDGTRLLAIRGYSGGMDQTRAVAVPVDGSGTGIEIEYPSAIQAGCCSAWEWAPDDSWILGTPMSGSGAALDQVLLDPVAGTSRTPPWTSASQPSWQRLAP